MRRACNRERGATLIELLSSTLLVSILMALSYSFARAALMSARLQETESEAQEVTVMALDMLVREIRMAGFSAAGARLTAVRTAGPDRVTVVTDLNGDGDTTDSNEVIAYGYSEEKHQLRRATGRGSPQPLVRDVPPDAVHFSFFDARGIEITPGEAGLTQAERARVHRIDILLRVELPNPDPTVAVPVTSTVSSSVCLRNQ
ncbi:MAG: PilW family protein [Candidatus Binatia bacterium]